MLFMIDARPKTGVAPDRAVAQLTGRLNPSTWDMVRFGTLSNAYYKTGGERGFFAILHAPRLEEAKNLAAKADATELFELEAIPVNHLPHFS